MRLSHQDRLLRVMVVRGTRTSASRIPAGPWSGAKRAEPYRGNHLNYSVSCKYSVSLMPLGRCLSSLERHHRFKVLRSLKPPLMTRFLVYSASTCTWTAKS
ncbi:hypothetical protein EJ02DRAFT_249805 [Clathrospora elynae]|uniref:Uncharacterized protein n=1 Tax=Clathrospora elynae TaxID=706981 RepID=A0A6A5T027_9PLEO|nr:hypothetical protein EJ02DRAFT_249805 [Clathrospora elynae]